MGPWHTGIGNLLIPGTSLSRFVGLRYCFPRMTSYSSVSPVTLSKGSGVCSGVCVCVKSQFKSILPDRPLVLCEYWKGLIHLLMLQVTFYSF